MATIKYDGQTRPSNLITYTDIPNILKVVDTGGGTYTTYTITLSGNLSSVTTKDGQWYISLLGETITNVTSPDNAISKNFFIASNNNSTAASICKALRNCSSIAANFTVMNNSNTVVLNARAIGPLLNEMQFTTNIDGTYISSTGTNGSASSSLYKAKIDVDIYSDGDYVTTLEKNYYGSEAAFNISPVLTTISKHGELTPYSATISAIKSDGTYSEIGTLPENYSAVGYMVNQGYKYNLATGRPVFAQNMLRGSNKDWYNNSILYVYEPLIAISCYRKIDSTTTTHINLRYLDSTGANIGPHSHYDKNYDFDAGTLIEDMYVDLDPDLLIQEHWIELEFEDMDPDNPNDRFIRYNVIKPMKATEHCQRLYFRNSYGGISFVDLTGAMTMTKDLDVMTYERNVFDYYNRDMNSLEKPYDTTVKDVYTIKSHLFEKDGKWIYNDLAQSPLVWTVINSEKYEIIISSVNVEETSNNNDMYEATVKFRFSEPTTLL